MVLRQVREEVDGRVLVERPVLPAVEEELRIVDAREGHHAPKEIRAAEEDDGRVQAAEAAADGNGRRPVPFSVRMNGRTSSMR